MTKKLKGRVKNVAMVAFDFDGVFTDNNVMVFEDGREAVICSRADGFGLAALRDIGIPLFVISSEINPVVSARCRKLGITCIQGCRDKAKALKDEASKLGIPMSRVAFLGNDMNDMACMKIAGMPACVKDSHPDIFKVAQYVTHTKGGRGAVREFCDLIREVKDER